MNNKGKQRQYFISILAVWLVASLAFGLNDFAGYHVPAFMLLVTVSILAMFFDIVPVLIAAVLSALIWDYFFIPPRFTFTIGTAEDQLLFLMYFIIASVNAVLTYKIRQIEKVARKEEEKAKTVKFYNTLLNSLSHELRTPIATIIGSSDNLMVNAEKLSEKNKNELVHEISKASLRLNEQVENLLSMSRLESGIIKPKKDWCDVNELVHSAMNRLQENLQHHKTEVRIKENLPLFKLDFVLMEEALCNLIRNATLYTPQDSLITIGADYTEYISDETIEKVNGKLIIEVSDNGKGFPEDEIEKVFEKFYRLKKSKAGGTGLGLSIVKGFVEAHNGTIKLENIPSGGAKFTIEIPAETSFLNNLKNE